MPPQPGSRCWRTGESPFRGGGILLSALPTSFQEKRAEDMVHLCNLEGGPTGMAEGIGPSEGSPSCLTSRGSPGSLLHRVGGESSSRCQLCLQNWRIEQWRAPLRQAGEAAAAAPAQVALPAPYPSTRMQGEELLLPFLEGGRGALFHSPRAPHGKIGLWVGPGQSLGAPSFPPKGPLRCVLGRPSLPPRHPACPSSAFLGQTAPPLLPSIKRLFLQLHLLEER